MSFTPAFGFYALGRGAMYFLVGAGAVIFGVGEFTTGAANGLGVTVFGALYLSIAFGLFLSGGLLTMERKIGRLLAILLLSVDAAFQGFEGYVTGSAFSLLFALVSASIVVYLVVRNPLSSGDVRTIDEESAAHDIGVE